MMDVIDRLEGILRSAGLPSEKCEIGLRCQLQMSNGGLQTVEIEPVVRTPEGKCYCFFLAMPTTRKRVLRADLGGASIEPSSV